MRTLVLTMVALSTSGCVFNHGMRTADLMPSGGARGTTGSVVLQSDVGPGLPRTLNGELLEVRDTALLLLSNDRLTLIHLDALRSVRMGKVQTARPHERLGDLRRHARYQKSLTGDDVQKLLAAYGLDSVIVLRRPRTEERPPAHSTTQLHTQSTTARQTAAFETFLGTARAAALPYSELAKAVAAGYRRLGPSFPGMGEHWIHPGLIVEGAIDPTRPPVLCYDRVNGEPRLVALAFTVPLGPGKSPPASPVPDAAWHGHSDQLDEEVLLLASNSEHKADSDAPTLAMFHAWLWLENPDGVLHQNNWRLPFVRAGLDVEEVHPSPAAGRALSLFTADADYYARIFQSAAEPDPVEMQRLGALIGEHRAQVERWLVAIRDEETLATARLHELEEIWTSLWRSIRSSVRPETWVRLARFST